MPTPVTQLTFSGDQRVTVQSTSSKLAQRFLVQGSLSDAVVPGTIGASLDVAGNGAQPWVLKLQNFSTSKQVWEDSELRLGSRTVTGARVSQVVESEDDASAGSDRDFNDLIVRVESVGSFSIPVAPAGVWPATLQVAPEGICEAAFGRHLLVVVVKNTGTESFASNAAVRLTDRCRQWLAINQVVVTDSWSASDAAVVGQTVTGAYVRLGALKPAESKRVYFKIDVSGAHARIYPLELQVGDPADAPGTLAPLALTRFFVSRTTFDSCQNALVASCDKGSMTVTLRGLAVDRHTWKKAVAAARSRFAAAAPAGQPCSPLVIERARRAFRDFSCRPGVDVDLCGALKDLGTCCGQPAPDPAANEDWIGGGGSGVELVVVPTDVSYRVDYQAPFQGELGPLPFDAVFWKALLMIAGAVLSAAASAALVAELAALASDVVIGTVKRAVLNALPAAPTGPPPATDPGSVDAAVVALDASRAIPAALFTLLDASASEVNGPPVATGGRIQLTGAAMTNSEIAGLLAAAATDPGGLEVYKSGAATGLTRGLLRALVPVVPRARAGKLSYFLNQLTIAVDLARPPAAGDLVAAGDSGALWIHARTGKIVALQHGATADGLAVATRIADVAQALNLRFA